MTIALLAAGVTLAALYGDLWMRAGAGERNLHVNTGSTLNTKQLAKFLVMVGRNPLLRHHMHEQAIIK